MRVTMNTMYDQINTDLGRIVEKQADTNTSIASGRIYHRPSDAPVALTHALNLRNSIQETKQYSRNIQYGKGWVETSESALQQIQDRLIRAKTLAIQGANGTLSSSDRKTLAKEVAYILEETVALGNTRLGNRYIFGGTKTTGYETNRRPFVLNDDGTVEYDGNNDALSIDVASNVTQTIGLDGKKLQDSKVFEALDLLHDALNANSDAGIRDAMGELDKAIANIADLTAILGAQANTLENKDEMAETLTVTNTERLSDLEDTDILEAITKLRTLETTYQAALASASKVMQISLANFI